METACRAKAKKRSGCDGSGGVFGEGSGTSSHTPEGSTTVEEPLANDPPVEQLAKKAKPFLMTPNNPEKNEAPTTVIQNLVADFMKSTNNSIEQGFVKMSEATRPVAPAKEPTKAQLVIKYVQELQLQKADRLCLTARLANNPLYVDFFIAFEDEDRRDFVNQMLTGEI